MPQCKAKSKRSGVQCKNHAMIGKEVCRIHGGKSLSGLAAPAFKHGRQSKYLPARLMERYTEALDDPDLLALRDELALLDARLADVLGRVDTGEAGRHWIGLAEAWRTVERSVNEVDRLQAMADLGDLIEQGVADYAAWDEVLRLIEQRRRLAESERKRLVEMQQMITVDRVMTLVAVLVDVVRRHVTDRQALSKISEDLRLYLNAPAGGGD